MIEITSAEDFAAVTEPGAEPLIGDTETNVLAAEALVQFYGSGGAGKTTLVLDLGVHLATAQPWLGLEIPRRRRCLWVENEGGRANFRLKLRSKIAAWDGPDLDGHLLVLEEPWAAFTFADELHRRQIAQIVEEYEIDVLIVGPLQTVGITGGGTPEDVQAFAELLAATRALVARPFAVILIHHENRSGQISGAWERLPDTLAHVTAQGNGRTRLLWQKCRWAPALHGRAWALHWTDGEQFELDDRPEVTPDTMVEELLIAVREYAGESWTTIRSHVRGKTHEAAKVRDRLLAEGRILNTAAREGQFRLWPSDDPAAGRSPAGTGWERPYVPPTSDGDVTVRSPFPSYKGTGTGTGTAEPVDAEELARLEALGEQLGLA